MDRPLSATGGGRSMSAGPLISIGIPVFNAAPWLRQSIESALDQDWGNVEVIAVDDGSTDESPSILRSFGDAIRVEHSSRQGPSAARNRVVSVMRGEWVQFLDADDYLLPVKLSAQLAEAGNPDDYDLLAAPVWWEDYTKDQARRMVPEAGTERWHPCQQILGFQIPQTAGFLWRRSELQRIGGWNESMRLNEDWELYLRAIRSGLRFQFTPSCNVVYRLCWSETQASMGPRQHLLKSNLELFFQMVEWAQANDQWNPELAAACGPESFRLLRHLAQRDLPSAIVLHDRLARLDLWRPADLAAGGFAPARYARIYRLLGFGIAERLARVFKSTPS